MPLFAEIAGNTEDLYVAGSIPAEGTVVLRCFVSYFGKYGEAIYVFTKDWADEPDVMRVRETLMSLGFTDRIGYKRNLDTYAGEYREKGKRVTFYSV